MTDGSVRLIFIGGIGEVGRSVLVFETDDDLLVVDCGIGFPDEAHLGVELVLPDFTYVRERADRLRGIVLTHGHEDHVGGLPFLLQEVRAPVYATPLTLGLVSVKLEEVGLANRIPLHAFDPDERPSLRLGGFAIEPFRVCHSIPDAVGFGISTPAGLIVVTGDYKFDPTPIDGRLTDYQKLAEFGERGVRLLDSDCVHVESPGQTPSERIVGETYDRVFGEAPGRIIIATFASLIARVQQVIDTAARHGKKVVLLGRSLENNARIARELGYLGDPEGVLIEPKAAASLPDDRIVYVVTGSQGEPMAVLARIAGGDHREVAVGLGDTVIVSATPIPGNETAVYRIINQLFRAGAEVLYGQRALVHVSGHASRDELARMLDLTRPANVLPCHGEARHMALYADLALELGWSPDDVTFAEAGDVIEVTPDQVAISGRIALEDVFVDVGRVGTVGEQIVQDRRNLARDGVVTVVVGFERESRELVVGPEVATRGFVESSEAEDLLDRARARVEQTYRDVLDRSDPDEWPEARSFAGTLRRKIQESLTSFLYRETRRRPLIVPVVVEVPSPDLEDDQDA
jgi:ribonuclease J